MLGAGTAGLATPFALGYSLHASRGGGAPGRAALAVASLEVLACAFLAAAWAWRSWHL